MSHPQPTPLTRRAVLQRGLAGIFASAVSPNIFPSSLFGKNAPSNRLTVGLVGNGLICNAHIGTLLGRDDCRILAVSDVWRSKAVKVRDRIEKSYAADQDKGTYKGVDIYAKFEDLIASGDVDPTKVTRTALQNAASVAGLLLTTECLITDLPEENKPAANDHHDH